MSDIIIPDGLEDIVDPLADANIMEVSQPATIEGARPQKKVFLSVLKSYFIDALAALVSSNTSDISTNSDNIDTNTTNIGTNTTNIGLNASAIGINTSDISTLTPLVSANTAKVSFPEAPVDGSTYGRKDAGWELLSITEALIQNFAHPIGEVYWQFPGKDDPNTLFTSQTWTNVSSEFAGDFFRAEGGNASTFESGEQADKMKAESHIHTMGTHYHLGGVRKQANYSIYQQFGVTSIGTQLYAREASSATASAISARTNVVDPGDTNSATTGSGNLETNPVNRTTRIWERTA